MKKKVPAPDIFLWLLGAAVILYFHGLMYEELRRSGPIGPPQTPIDHVSPDGAAQWRFLMDARPWIPDGADYTVESSGPDREMSLFMLSLGIYPRSHALPTTYFGMPFASIGARARYVLDEGCRLREPGRRTLVRLSGGCVERRE